MLFVYSFSSTKKFKRERYENTWVKVQIFLLDEITTGKSKINLLKPLKSKTCLEEIK